MLLSCLQPLDSSTLKAKSGPPVQGADCASCHPYELKDENHFYHITYSDLSVKRVNGKMTCLDCHRTSMQSRPLEVLDTIYRDSAGTLRSSIDFPLYQGLGEMKVIRVDTLRQDRPIPSPGVAPGRFEVQEWMTGLAHMNGIVDVVFDAKVTDKVRFAGQEAVFNPASETCSAMSCHEDPGPYRFKAVSKGLSGLDGDSLPVPQPKSGR